jgi:predicted Ser/Thr protein kinase
MPDVYVLRQGDPATVAGYTLVGRLGEGGQGIVFLARDSAGQSVAIKLLHARLAGDERARTRFTREISAAKRVAEFSTARVLDADIAGEPPYIVTEYVDGPPLQRAVAEQGPYSPDALRRLAVGTATALNAIHQAGIVHRDFKPANVLLGPDGPRVIDFGIARVLDTTATLTSQAVGTPAYMAPEQLSRGPIGPPADVFAWGATMVFAATGTAPFGDDTVPAVIRRVLRAEPDLSGVAEPLRGLLADCLAKDPRSRPTIRQVLDRISGERSDPVTMTWHPTMLPADGTLLDRPQATAPALGQWGGASAPPAGYPHAPPPDRARKRRLWLAAVAAVLVTAAVAGIGVWAFAGEPMKFTRLASGGCAMVPSATVRRVVAEPHVSPSSNEVQDHGEKIETTCEWDSLDGPAAEWESPDGPAAPFLQLSIAVTVERDLPYAPDGDPPKGLDRAKSDQRHDRNDFRDRAARPRVDGSGPTSFAHYPGRFTELGDLGDEGFLTSEHVRKGDGSYDPRMAYAHARLGNALISVTYIAGDRPAGHVMTPAAEATVRRDTETVARDVLRYLSHCKACTR